MPQVCCSTPPPLCASADPPLPRPHQVPGKVLLAPSDFGPSLVGANIASFWPDDGSWWSCKVVAVDKASSKAVIYYPDTSEWGGGAACVLLCAGGLGFAWELPGCMWRGGVAAACRHAAGRQAGRQAGMCCPAATCAPRPH